MKQILLLITTCVFSSQMIAQNLSNKYKDSVKDFFLELSTAQKDFGSPLILDNPILLYNYVDSIALLEDNKHFRFNINRTKVYKYKYPINDVISSRIDSIAFSKNEMQFLIAKMQTPAIQNWDTEIFPTSHFVNKREVDSFFKLYYFVWGKAVDVIKKCDYVDTIKMKNYSVYRQYKQMQRNILWYQGYWKVSNPIFLKNGKVALVFYWHFYGNTYVSHCFNVYKKENGHWNYFGYINGGNIN